MLGILGGMGPAATVDFLSKVIAATPAERDQDHLEMVVVSATLVPDRVEALLHEGPSPLPAMTTALRRLEAAGATLVAIPCNTAHHWYDGLSAASRLPILHIADALIDALRCEGATQGDTVGLLATSGTLRAGIYQERLGLQGLRCILPSEQEEVTAAIQLVKRGAMTEASALLHRQAGRLLERGCGRIALACTEIPLALTQAGPALAERLVDSTEALARACVAHFCSLASHSTRRKP